MPSSHARSLRRSTTDQCARKARRARRWALYREVQALHAQGFSKRHIVKPLQVSRTTVFPERARPRRESLLDPSVASRQKRWDAGCHHGVELWREMQALGFSGTRRMVCNWVVLRRELERSRPSAHGQRPALPTEPAMHLLPASAAGGDDCRRLGSWSGSCDAPKRP